MNIAGTPSLPRAFGRFTETPVKEIDSEMRSAYALSANVCERSTRSIRLRLSESAATASSAQITRSEMASTVLQSTETSVQNGGSVRRTVVVTDHAA
jgi:hypothetical protein